MDQHLDGISTHIHSSSGIPAQDLIHFLEHDVFTFTERPPSAGVNEVCHKEEFIAFIYAHVNLDSHRAEWHADFRPFMDDSSDVSVSIPSTLCKTYQ